MSKPGNRSNAAWLALSLLSVFYIALFWWVRDDPFHGDAISTISRAARLIYDSNFQTIAYPQGLDPGHPITFPLLYAMVWKVFGMGLAQSHIINFIFSAGIAMYVFKWVRREAGETSALLATLLLICIPQFVANTAQMNTHLPLSFFVLGLAYALRFNQTFGKILFSSAILLTHLQGLYFLLPLWLWWFAMESKFSTAEKIKHMASMLALPLLLFCGWLAYHYSITGWWLSSPDYAAHRGTPGIKRIFINLVLSDWRISDYGQIALFIVPVIVVFKRNFVFRWTHPLSIFLMLYFFNALTLSVTTQTGPAHRYLLACLPFLVMANAHMFKDMKLSTWGLVIAILLSGHFWFYPGKVMGDATLAYRDVFPLLEQIEKDFPNAPKHSYAPLSNASKYTRLTEVDNDYLPLYDLPLDSTTYVLRSNISGDFPRQQIDEMQTNWQQMAYQRGYVYVELYANPTLVHLPTTRKRTISGAERWMQKLKEKIKGRDAH